MLELLPYFGSVKGTHAAQLRYCSPAEQQVQGLVLHCLPHFILFTHAHAQGQFEQDDSCTVSPEVQ